MPENKRLVVITGPTSVGKTAVISRLAEKHDLEIINLDSCNVYAYFKVGTGRRECRPGTHLLGFLSPLERMSPRTYVDRALAVVDELEHAGRPVLFEGGSRSYPTALFEARPLYVIGIPPPPGSMNRQRLRARVDAFFEDGALVREVEGALKRGYGDAHLMRDPLIYRQTQALLSGKKGLEQTKEEIVEGLLDMQRGQMAVFETMDIRWADPSADVLPQVEALYDEWRRLG